MLPFILLLYLQNGSYMTWTSLATITEGKYPCASLGILYHHDISLPSFAESEYWPHPPPSRLAECTFLPMWPFYLPFVCLVEFLGYVEVALVLKARTKSRRSLAGLGTILITSTERVKRHACRTASSNMTGFILPGSLSSWL
jgi:hypothetical protein